MSRCHAVTLLVCVVLPLTDAVALRGSQDSNDDETNERSKVALVVIEALGLGFLGIDRMYIGGTYNIICGVAKLLTCGGCGFWFLLDYCVIMINGLSMASSLHFLGMSVEFESRSIGSAFAVALIALVSSVLLGSVACVIMAQAPAATRIPGTDWRKAWNPSDGDSFLWSETSEVTAYRGDPFLLRDAKHKVAAHRSGGDPFLTCGASMSESKSEFDADRCDSLVSEAESEADADRGDSLVSEVKRDADADRGDSLSPVAKRDADADSLLSEAKSEADADTGDPLSHAKSDPAQSVVPELSASGGQLE